MFECPALQGMRDRYGNLFRAPQGDAMILFMWQDDIIGVARFIDACLERVYTSAGPPVGTRHLISPELAGKDVRFFFFLHSGRLCGGVCGVHMDTRGPGSG